MWKDAVEYLTETIKNDNIHTAVSLGYTLNDLKELQEDIETLIEEQLLKDILLLKINCISKNISRLQTELRIK